MKMAKCIVALSLITAIPSVVYGAQNAYTDTPIALPDSEYAERGDEGEGGGSEGEGSEGEGSKGSSSEGNRCVYAKSLNNKLPAIDRKHSADVFEQLWTFYKSEKFGMTDTTFESEESAGNRYWETTEVQHEGQSDEFVTAKSWLIENEVLERPAMVAVQGDTSTAQRIEGWYTKEDTAIKSDVLSMLYKGIYGVIDSRVVDYAYTDSSFNQAHLYLTTGNVYEQYFQKMIEKGLINNSDLKDDLLGSAWDGTAVWNQSVGAAGRLATGMDTYNLEDCTGVWGKSFVFETTEDSISITPIKPEYFNEESMTFIEFLEIVENFLRGSEKEVTATEASIVAYKYGLEYLSELTEDEYKTVEFLVAKGILNFEEYDSIGFFETVRWQEAIPVIYRAVNTNARYNFSLVQLTDGEAFWQEKGFSSGAFTLTVPTDGGGATILETVSVDEDVTVLGKLEKLFSVCAASKAKKYTVVKDFDTVNSYTYKGLTLEEIEALYNSGNGVVSGCPEITKVSSTTVNGIDVIRVSFSIVATSSSRAIQMVDDCISAVVKDATAYKITGVIKIRDGKEIRLISKSSIKRCFGSKIDFIEDKVLRSVETGETACILPEAGYALVGNQVYVDETLIAVDTNKDVYYNFDIVSTLLGMSVIEFYADSVNTQRIASHAKAGTASVYSSSGIDLGTVEYLQATLSGSGDDTKINFDNTGTGATTQNYYCVNQIPNGINSVYRIFYERFSSKSNAKKEPFIVLVDWVYAVPSLENFNAASILPEEVANGTTATWNEVFEVLYTPPAEGTPLRAWWDSNMAMSQGLTAMLFEQPGVEYVKCGYMVPKVTVLLPDSADKKYFGSDSLRNVSELLIKHGFAVSTSYSDYFSGGVSDFLNDYYVKFQGLTASNAAYTSLRTFASVNRSVQVIKGKAYKNNYKEAKNYSFGDEFYAEGSQVLYRNVAFDTRLECKTSNGQLSAVTIKDRIGDGTPKPPVGSIVKCSTSKGERDYLYLGIVTKLSGLTGYNQYLMMVPIYDGAIDEMPKFKVSKSLTGSVTAAYESGQKYSTWAECVKTNFYNVLGVSNECIEDDSFLNTSFSDGSGANIFALTDKSATAVKSAFGSFKKFGLFYNNALGSYKATNNGWRPNGIVGSVSVSGLPCVYLPAGNWYVYQPSNSTDWVLGVGETGYLLNQSTLYYSGIIDGIIDAILAKAAKTTTIGELDDGTVLLIADTKWVKEGGYWNSYPIKNANAAGTAKRGAAYALTAFSTIYSSFPIECDGIDVPLGNYVESCTLGTRFLDKLPNKTVCVTANDGGGVRLVKMKNKTLKTVKNSVSATHLVLKVDFDDSLLVRPINSDGSIYKVCNSASERVIAGTQVPFFNEDLSYNSDNQIAFNLSQGGFENTAEFEIERTEFNSDFSEGWNHDFKVLVAMWIVVAASYMMVVSWAVYLGVTKGACLWLLDAIAGRVHGVQRKGEGKGIDVIKLMSFGVYNLDTPPLLSRCVVVTIVCLVIVAICINFV